MRDLTAEEAIYVERLLVGAQAQLRHELHHAVTHEFKEKLKVELALNERLAVELERAFGLAKAGA